MTWIRSESFEGNGFRKQSINLNRIAYIDVYKHILTFKVNPEGAPIEWHFRDENAAQTAYNEIIAKGDY